MFLEYIKPRMEKLLERKFLLELFTFLYKRPIKPENSIGVEEGTIFLLDKDMTQDNAKYCVFVNGSFLDIPPPVHNTGAPFSIHDKIIINSSDILNYKGESPITTTIGRFITNYILLVHPAKDLIPYFNDVWNITKIENIYAKLILDGKLECKDYRQYIDNGYFIGHFSEICVPTLSRKSMTTDPRVKELKKELLEKYKDQLDDPKIVSMIEQQLITLDKNWIKGDSSEGFFGVTPKSYNIHRKKMFLMVGGVEDFSDGNNTTTVSHCLTEGWDPKNFQAIANEIRKGSYARGKETCKGGEMTKLIFRTFQDMKIVEDDCGTHDGLTITFKDNITPEMFIGRYVIVKKDGKYTDIEITQKNADSFNGKTVMLRSPMFCKTKFALCYKCCGNNFKKLNIVSPGIKAIEISSTFMTASLKSMHGTVISTNSIDPFEFFNN